jgi:large subunit ribosomal protein L9
MSIEVILREHVDNLGKRGEVVKVADGYARNFLFPRKLALAVTTENKRQIERERAKADAREAEVVKEAESLRAKVEAVELTAARRVGENNVLYGSVTSADVADLLAARGVTVDRRKIHLPEPLKALGDHKVSVKLYRDVLAEITVKVVPAE